MCMCSNTHTGQRTCNRMRQEVQQQQKKAARERERERDVKKEKGSRAKSAL